jgi:thioesterase domain-containing protein
MTTPVAAATSTVAGSYDAACQRLRPGRPDEALFLMPGVEGDTSELTDMIAALDGPQDVYVVSPALREGAGIERLAVDVIAAIRAVQPVGPYRLGGYSFGALLALETAQQLTAAGEKVEALFLIEAVYDERYWPRSLWLKALARRTVWQLGRIVRMRPTKAAGELFRRATRLIQRFSRRKADATENLGMGGDTDTARWAYAAIGGYRPRYYGGSLTLIASSVDRHFGCDTVRLWAGYADHLSIQRVEGDHLTVMHEPVSAAAVAHIVDHGLGVHRKDWPGVRPHAGFERPLILTTMRWFAVARLTHALIEAGFSVAACRPQGHVLELIDGLSGDYRLNRLWRMRSLMAAIRKARPDIILPDDERALALLRRLYPIVSKSDPQTAELVARSLGTVEDWPAITSRTGLATLARSLDVTAPATEVVGSAEALGRWADDTIVLKTDGSWGGRGVAVIPPGSDLREAWRTMSNPPSLPRALKRMIVNLEIGGIAAWLRRVHPIVNAQGYVAGREAIATVACLRGEVQALMCLEVMQASEPKGPAAVVRIIDHPGMAEAARRLVGRFGLSGFCGFDFILDDSGEAHLLEMNPRVTPTCHLLVEGDFQRSRTIALFPAERRVVGADIPIDLPQRVPALLRRGEELAVRKHRPVARIARRLKQKVVTSRY